MTEIKNHRPRIEWIDFTKGISIIGTIVSHCAPLGSMLRNALFSFHMPLFFILSGYTMTPAKDIKTLYKKTKKDAKTLLLPVVIFSAIRTFGLLILSEDLSLSSATHALYGWLNSLFWSSGVEELGHPALGMLWFLVSMFTARFIINIVHVIFGNDEDEVILIALGGIGIILGVFEHRLPFNFDVSLASIFFLAIGLVAKKNTDRIKKFSTALFFIAISIWLFCIYRGYAIEMATRFYGINLLVIIEAICACYVVIRLCMQVCKVNVIKKPLVFIGMNSLFVLCFHNIDILIKPIWDKENLLLACLMRVSIAVASSSAFIYLKQLANKRQLDKRSQLLKLLCSTLLRA